MLNTVQCPKCKSDRAYRSHRRGISDYFLSFWGYLPYRCHECQHRFRFHAGFSAPRRASNSTEREIRKTRAAAKWRKTKTEAIIFGVAVLLFLVFLYLLSHHGQ